MSYIALYRRFRPSKFKEILGQEHITRTLKNQIIANRVGHAYLFSGGRGTGKTSAAKILSRVVNCLAPHDGEPCNECDVCKGILSSSIIDVVEMDAASNNGVENIRQIREEVVFLPTLCKYRVYIIDEVHMLSTGAFNALLKTLEEPPSHIIFILATTEPQRLPATILSRCQRFDFKRISDENIIKKLDIICNEMNIKIEEQALKVIASLSEGALRDAISILERCIVDGDKEITEEKIKDLVGIPKTEYMYKILYGIIENNSLEVLKIINEVLEDGKDLMNLLWEMIKYTRDVLTYKASGIVKLYNEEEVSKIDELSQKVSKEKLLFLIKKFSEIENDVKWSSQQRIIFEAAIVRICEEKNDGNIFELENRIKNLENKLAGVNEHIIQNPIVSDTSPKQIKNEKKMESTDRAPKQIVKSIEKTQSTDNEYLSEWEDIIKEIKNNGKVMLYTNLINTKAKQINDMIIGIEFAKGGLSFGKTVVEKEDNMHALKKAIVEVLGKDMHVKCLEQNNNISKKESSEIQDFEKELGIKINIIDG
jgi:DNA polymerase III, subunit gamma and tau